MIKKHQKLIAMSVVFTFLCLLQVSTMPLRSEQSPGQTETAISNDEQGPNFVEQEGAPYSSSKKSIVPIVLIGLGVVAVAAVLVLVVFKTKYDLRGTWSVTTKWGTSTPTTWSIVFSGERTSGTFIDSGMAAWIGTYTVDGKKATWHYGAINSDMVFSAEFTGKDSLTGTMVDPPDSGTFTATRTAAAAGIGNSAPGGKAKETK